MVPMGMYAQAQAVFMSSVLERLIAPSATWADLFGVVYAWLELLGRRNDALFKTFDGRCKAFVRWYAF